jgi:N-methylhydantoinase A
MEAEARDWIRGEGDLVGAARIAVTAEMRYPGQAYELSVTVPEAARADRTGRAWANLFHDEHRRLYGFAETDMPARINTLRVAISAPTPTIDLPPAAPAAAVRPRGTRRVFLDGAWVAAALYDRADLGAGSAIDGPAIVSQPDTTILVLPGWRGETDFTGNLLLSRR